MKRYFLYTLLAVCLFSLPILAQEISLQSKHYSVKDGLGCNTINDAIQDKDGYIWFGTTNGFSRFDGYSFVNFTQLGLGDKDETASNISQLLNDNHNGLVWGYTPQQNIYCFELARGRFVDYTGKGDFNRPFWNKTLSHDGIWLYTQEFGARHITYQGGKFTSQDYTCQNGLLQDSVNLQILEDRNHNVWISSTKELVRLTPQGKRQTLLSKQHINIRTLGDDYYAVLTSRGDAYLYNLEGKLIKRSHLPSMMPLTGKSRASMFWKGAWYIFSEGDTYAMDIKTGRFFKPTLQVPNAIDKIQLPHYKCLYDKKGNLYLFAKNGWSKKLHLIDDPAIINARDRNFSVSEDAFGRLFIASYGMGLYVYTPKTDELQHFSAKDKTPLFETDFLLNILIDRYNCIWLTSNYGVYCLTEIDGLHNQYIKMEASPKSEWNNFVRNVSYIGDDRLAVSTKTNDTYLYNIKTGQSTPTLHTNATVYAYQIDREGNTWIATKGDGFTLNGKKYSSQGSGSPCPSNKIYDFAFDRLGRTWIATWEEGLLLTQKQGSQPLHFQQMLTDNSKESQIHDLFIDSTGYLWACTNNGLCTVDTRKKRVSDRDFIRFNIGTGDLPTNRIISGMQAKDGSLWFCTNQGVLRCRFNNHTRKLSHETFNTDNGLINNTTRSLSEDRHGNIWVTTEEGLSRINGKTKKIKSFILGNQTSENTFTENCVSQLPDGTLVFGSENGLLLLRPDQSKNISHAPLKATITDMTINGQSIYNKDMEGLLDKALNYTQEIVLPHDKNNLSISFSNFYYPEIGSTMYQYYLEGLDDDWHPMTSINHVEYSELQPGHYTLHLRTLDTDNQWSEETLLKITIRQPWYNTIWAWFLYLIILGGIGYNMYRAWRKNFELSQQMKVDKQILDFRLDFFTHISHEFRTPLSIIQSAIEKLMTSEDGSISKRTLLTLSRGSKRMQRLINQLMEFRKANTGNMKLNVERGNIVAFIRNIYNDIYEVAKQKDINMSFTPSLNKLDLVFDPHMVETITYNLLSNAVKYTPDKGVVEVKLTIHDNLFVLTVEDNGPGIKPEREQELFKPFMHGYVSKGGMGIGLYTAHEMALLHKGSLTYHRSSRLGGSLFTLTLPTDEKQYAPEDYAEKLALDTTSIERPELDAIVKEMTPQAINNVTVMVIEDDPDMMEQIKSELSVYFKVVAFMNGKTGYENIKQVKPALLISDIMLPGMSGYEIVSNLKADPETQNIPVIMLTAFDDASHILKAYKSFVDDYMVKPCNFKLLIARALQFVSMDKKEKKAVTAKQETSTQDPSTQEPTILTSTQDKKFKDKLEAIVARHLGDSNFNVDRLAELLNVGRTTLYNRTKSIIGISPNIYIQNERLRLASQLLLEGEYTVAEISDKVGFSDPTYFYKCFKNKFGVAPSKYGK